MPPPSAVHPLLNKDTALLGLKPLSQQALRQRVLLQLYSIEGLPFAEKLLKEKDFDAFKLLFPHISRDHFEKSLFLTMCEHKELEEEASKLVSSDAINWLQFDKEHDSPSLLLQ